MGVYMPGYAHALSRQIRPEKAIGSGGASSIADRFGTIGKAYCRFGNEAGFPDSS
jgi:hypothetical protein